jgi:thioesterase domain-containing protein
VRWTAAGELDYLNRTDNQVKIRGFRIELGEIEAALLAVPGVARAAVVVRADRPGDPRLVAYHVPAPAPAPVPSGARLREALGRTLPGYMVPSAFVTMDAFPLTANGKLDRSGLPAPEPAPEVSGDRPASPTEQVLCDLFAEVLGLPSVGVRDGFFDLGGHSMLAGRLLSRIRTALDTDLPIRTLFEASTPAALATRLTGGGGSDAFDTLLPLRAAGSRSPVFCVHPTGCIAWSYLGLARHIGPDVPLYGLQARGVLDGCPLPSSVAEMAADYIAELRRVQPQGPYRLLGWSFGGVVAHEMACQLEDAGQSVSLLASLDSDPVPDGEDIPDDRLLCRNILEFFGYDADFGAGGPTVADMAGLLRREDNPLAVLDETRLGNLLDVWRNNVRLHRDFAPRRFTGPMVHFAAVKNTDDPARAARRWAPHVTGGLTVHDVSTDHEHLMTPTPLAAIGAVLATELD